MSLSIDRLLTAPAIEGDFARDSEPVRQLARGPEQMVLVDLSAGTPRGSFAAHCCRAQLGLSPAPVDARWSNDAWSLGRGLDKTSANAADLIGAFVDLEGRGSAAAWGGYTHACAVLTAAATRPGAVAFVIIVPQAAGWAPEDEWFVRFLLAGSRDTAHRTSFLSTGPCPSSPPGWTARWRGDPSIDQPGNDDVVGLLPGVFDPDVQRTFEAGAKGCLSLGGNAWWVPPEFRPRRPSRGQYDRLAKLAENIPWLRAYAMMRGSVYFVDPWFLCAQAWARFAEGGQTLALRMMEHATACARDQSQRCRMELELQGLRIAMQQFAAAAQASDPPAGLPDDVTAGLWQMRGWARTFLGRAVEGRADLEKARAVLPRGRRGERQEMYFDNIHALSLFRTGDIHSAVAAERQLERQLDLLEAAAQPDWQLRFVNCINQARLFRAQGDFDRAQSMYERAFETCRGLASESDAIYEAVCAARLAEARGRPAEAFGAWVRACLIWVSAELPEAIACRTATAIVGRYVAPDADSAADVTASLSQHLCNAADSCAAPRRSAPEIPTILSAAAARRKILRPTRASWDLGWSLLAADERVLQPIDSPGLRELRATLARFLAVSGPTWIVDLRDGRGMPLDAATRAEAALSWSMPPETPAGADIGVYLALGPGVDRVNELDEDKIEVRFKRIAPPLYLAGDQAALVRAVLRCKSGSATQPSPAGKIVEALEANRVIHRRCRIIPVEDRRAGTPSQG